MHFRGNPQHKPGAPVAGKKRRWAKMAMVPMFGGFFAYSVAVPPSNISVEGLMYGDLIPVAPMYRAQVTQPLANCYSKVKAGEPLAIVSNFLLDEQYSSEYQIRMEALRLEQINLKEGAASTASGVQAAKHSYQAAAAAEAKMKALAEAYDELYAARAIGRVASESARSDWIRASAETGALRESWQKSQLGLEQSRKGSTERINSLEKQLALIEATRKRVSVQPILSPASGQVLDCTAHPGAVVEAGTPIYRVFDTDRAYVMAFADQSGSSSLSVGMPVNVTVPGVSGSLPGHIAAVTPEATKLPEPLTRYFWQHTQWSQYRPIKITLDNLDALKPEVREKLVFNGKVQVSVPVSSWGDWFGKKV